MILYKILSYLLSPFLIIWFYARCLIGKDHFEHVKNHFGLPSIKRKNGKFIWVHAASIGESLSALTYINHIKKRDPDLYVLITTITVTSAEILDKRLKNIPNCYHQFVVADVIPWIRRFLDHWDVSAAFFMESEIWPNIISELKKREIPVYLLNARLSKKSFKRWMKVRGIFSNILSKYSYIFAQSEGDFERFSFFSNSNIVKIDNLKYANDRLPIDANLSQLFTFLCKNKKIIVAASTHQGEEKIIFEAFKKIKKNFECVLIVIPRHLNRVQNIKKFFENSNEKIFLRSSISNENIKKLKNIEIFIIDTFGEVGTFFSLADICFVGGSLVPVGGHNIYEPVMFGKPVIFGEYMSNALEVRDLILNHGVGFEVNNASQIAEIFQKLLQNPDELKKISEKAIKITKNSALNDIDSLVKL